ncbi:30S ribosomal protein S6 [Calorimonas adulescens]|jgi:ribosomal protein S6|uniref:Small ribosomal subunit protein bS6 n=1 Tax=Calorimonas adulescens TaxID=2606906 RepID=A0A5D8Q8Z1_9THEO|nr:30S ribosomal protein S6 [Calorimonas adulescens]TZE80847.1 30S ribosomal protein S6 [Calorimonas adulescens]
MRAYEAMYIIDPDIDEENRQKLIERFKGIVEGKGELVKLDEWGRRRLAYPINKKNEGYYVLMNFNSDANAQIELERVFKITDGVMRYMIVKMHE